MPKCSSLFPMQIALTCLVLVGCGGRENSGPFPTEPGPGFVSTNTGAWTSKMPMPTARSEFAITNFRTDKGKPYILAIGGLTLGSSGLTETAVVEAYDPEKNMWFPRAPMPRALFQTNGATVYNDKVYVVGGWTTTDASPSGGFFEYTPGTDTWRTLSGGDGGSGASGVIGDALFMSEGSDGTGFNQRFLRYDFLTDTWTRLAPIPHRHYFGTAGVIGGKFYLVGGSDDVDDIGGDVDLDVYDPSTDTWLEMAPMQIPRRSATSAVINGKLYVFGGADTGSPIAEVEIYDPATDSWSFGVSNPHPQLGQGAAAFRLRGTPVASVIGGRDDFLTTFEKRNQVFDPALPIP